MPRIGIFIDALEGSIPASFRGKIAKTIREIPNVRFCVEEERLASPEALARMANRLETQEVDRVVIVGGSPKLYETSFLKGPQTPSLNPYLFTVANILELALWSQIDEGKAVERAGNIIAKTIRMVSAAQSIASCSLALKPVALIIGGGIVAISVARALSGAGIQVFLVEKEEKIGGRASELRTFYSRPGQVTAWLKERISEIEKDPNVTLLIQSEVKSLKGHFGRFQAEVIGRDGAETLLAPSVVVVATGYGKELETSGLSGHRKFVTLTQMEELLAGAQDSSLSWQGKQVETVTYLLDQVNEDMQVDTINAVKQSVVLQDAFQCQVAVLCKDVKVSVDGMERLYRKAREKGVLFFKYEEPPRLSLLNDQIQVDVKDTAAVRQQDQWQVSILSDVVVVSEAMVPSPGTESLSEILKIDLGSRGFLMEDNPQLMRIRSNRRGIFVAGACRFPQALSTSLIEARAVAQEAIALISNGDYTYDLAVAEVDPAKCALCYTCPRLCPHSAITVERYAEQNVYRLFSGQGQDRWGAAKVDPAACYGCGICVAECPARAITLRHLTDEMMYAQMNLMVDSLSQN